MGSRRTSVSFVAGAVLIGVPACCGDDGATAIPLQDFATRYRDAACERAVRCGEYPDSATCAASIRVDFGQEFVEIAAGKAQYDPTAGASCIAAVAAAHCSGVVAPPELDAACAGAFKGTLGFRATCFSNAVCTAGTCMFPSDCPAETCCQGRCAASVPAIGHACDPITGTGVPCPAGSFCKPDALGTTPAVCAPRVQAGQPCTLDVGECVPDAFCLSGVCTKFAGQGESCSQVFCAAPLTCNPSTDTCMPPIPLGGACPDGIGCIGYAACDLTTLTCVVRAGIGGACASDIDCLKGLDCAAYGTCQRRAPRTVCQ